MTKENRKVLRENLGIIIPKYALNEVLLTSFFMPKEAVLIMARKMGIFLYQNHNRGSLFETTKQEGMRLRNPGYDEKWFSNNKKAKVWEKEFP